MKSRIYILTFVAALVGAQAFATFTDIASGGAKPSGTWEKVTTTVKIKVGEWLSYWQGGKAPPATEVAKATTPGTPKSTAPVTVSAPPKEPAAQVATTVSEESQSLRKQAIFETKAEGSTLKDVEAARDSLKAMPIVKTATPARVGTSKLTKSKDGVPLANWKQVKAAKTIPRLDIGDEMLISREDFTLPNLKWGLAKASEFKKLPSPKPVAQDLVGAGLALKVAHVGGPRGLLANKRSASGVVTLETVEKVKYTVNDIPDFKENPYKPLSEDQLKMMAALILFDKGGRCHMIMGLFHQLASAEKTKIEATYYLGACAAQLKMHQSAFDHLSKVIASEDKDFAPLAIVDISKDLPLIYERDLYKLVKSLKNQKGLISSSTPDEVPYRLAKGAYRNGEFKISGMYAELVPANSDFSDDAHFLSAMNSFALGDKATAVKKLQGLWESLEARKSVANGNIRALTSLNLARMYFSQQKFDKALENYMYVPKDHPLWVQALIEQGWTQLAMSDYSGAIGNMYSLHSPYFKAVYQPESFVVRTIGYLNICQYGDAYKSLTWLEKDYRDWYGKTSHYLETKGTAKDIYTTVKNYIRGKSDSDVDGVPFQVWREMAHRKDFLNVQTALNDKQDEAKRYEGVNEKIKTEKAGIRWHADQAKKRFDNWRNQIARAKVDRSMLKNVDQMAASMRLERDLTIGYRFQLAILEQSRQGYLDFQSKSQVKLDTETSGLTSRAGDILLVRAKHMQKEMERDLENNEFLRYEVFSGAGENIRYQVAGGKVEGPNRIPAHIKPTKMMNWSFDGEFWEDEIGSYRSSLQNSCPATASSVSRKAERVPTSEEQARHSDTDDEN